MASARPRFKIPAYVYPDPGTVVPLQDGPILDPYRNVDGCVFIKPLEYIDKSVPDIRHKLDQIMSLRDAFKPEDVVRIGSAFDDAQKAVDEALSAINLANCSIALANECIAAAVLCMCPTKDEMIDYEREIKLFSEQARKALDFYKETKGEEFELIEIKNFETKVGGYPYWITHFTFTAKPKDDSCPPKLFFAEVYEHGGSRLGEYHVKMCMTLDPSGQDVIKGCDYVHGDANMLHPKGVQFWAGPPSGTRE